MMRCKEDLLETVLMSQYLIRFIFFLRIPPKVGYIHIYCSAWQQNAEYLTLTWF